MGLRDRIRRFDKSIGVVPPSTAIIMIFFGLIHLFVNIGGVTDLLQIRDYNWGIYKSLGLADSFQLPLMIGLLIFDGFIMFYGIYLLRHVEWVERKKSKFKPEGDDKEVDYKNKDHYK